MQDFTHFRNIKGFVQYLFVFLILHSLSLKAQVVLNEVMARPGGNQGLIVFNGNSGNEYVELYNPTCSPVNVSGFFIACRQDFAGGSGGSFRIPNVPAAIIQPGSHLVIGTATSSSDPNSIDIKLPDYTSNYCQNNSGANFILANADGWMALYDAAGTPINAIYWSSASTNISQTSDFGGLPCVPPGSPGGVILESAQQINASFPGVLVYAGANPAAGQTYSRIPDGGNWQQNITPSINDLNVGNCNGGTCVAVSSIQFSASSTNATCGNSNGSIAFTVTSSGSSSYSWSANANTANAPIASNLSAGTYTVTINQNGCTKDTSITLISSGLPQFTTAVTQPTCAQSNGSIVLNVTSAGIASYSWSTNANTANFPNASSLAAGTYTVTVYQNGCTNDTSISLNSNSSLSVTITNPVNPTCGNIDGSLRINLSGGTAPYTVTIDTGGTPFTITIPIATNQTINNLAAGTVVVNVTDNAGCQASTTRTLTAPINCCNISLNAVLTPPTCGGSNASISITALNGSGNYTYSWSVNAANGNTPTAINLVADTYFLTLTDNGTANCFIDTSFTITNTSGVTIDSFKILNAPCDGSALGGSVTVFASSVNGVNVTTGYTWSNTASDNDDTQSDLAPGTYLFTVTDLISCQATGSVTINLQTGCCTLQAASSATPTTCSLPNGSIIVNISNNGFQPYRYFLVENALAQTTNSFNNLSDGNYTIIVTDSLNCADTIVTNVAPSINDISISLSSNNVSCNSLNDGNAILTINAGSNSPFAISWSNGINDSLTLNNLQSGTYFVTVTNQVNCFRVDSFTINEPLPIIINLDDSAIICSGETLVLDAANQGASYLWSTGEQTSSFAVNNASTYSVTVSLSSTCFAVDTITIGIDTLAISISNDTIINERESVVIATSTLGGSNNNPAIYNWSPALGLSCNDCASPTATPSESTTYTVVYTNSNGCTAQNNITIEIIPGEYYFYMPNAFSPNGDGENETLFPIFKGVEQYTLRIWNRWGQKVYECVNTNSVCQWDGTVKSKLLDPSVFVWEAVVEYKKPSIERYKGSLTLIK